MSSINSPMARRRTLSFAINWLFPLVVRNKLEFIIFRLPVFLSLNGSSCLWQETNNKVFLNYLFKSFLCWKRKGLGVNTIKTNGPLVEGILNCGKTQHHTCSSFACQSLITQVFKKVYPLPTQSQTNTSQKHQASCRPRGFGFRCLYQCALGSLKSKHLHSPKLLNISFDSEFFTRPSQI